ncbi:hypothetical protein M0802_005036 [Mischocyttarus mexicanus]|nr:hypothetical protein M0802_005036 [Mischocyttarus mexicanus]
MKVPVESSSFVATTIKLMLYDYANAKTSLSRCYSPKFPDGYQYIMDNKKLNKNPKDDKNQKPNEENKTSEDSNKTSEDSNKTSEDSNKTSEDSKKTSKDSNNGGAPNEATNSNNQNEEERNRGLEEQIRIEMGLMQEINILIYKISNAKKKIKRHNMEIRHYKRKFMDTDGESTDTGSEAEKEMRKLDKIKKLKKKRKMTKNK